MTAADRIGDYELLEELGRGGYGVVWRARRSSLPEREVALKEVPLPPGDDPARERTLREVRALVRIDSLHIVRLHDAFEAADRGTLCIVMEKLERATLRHRIARAGGPLPLEFVLETIDGVLDALEATHGARDDEGGEMPIVHRDLKPENVGFARWRDGEIVKVMDFGVARVSRAGADRFAHSLGTLHAYTPAYAPPEVLMGLVAKPPADLWSAGMMLWEMLVGRHPFADESGTIQSPLQALVANQGVPPPLPPSIAAALPPVVVDLQRDLCAHDPELRPTASEARARLRQTAGYVPAPTSQASEPAAPASAPVERSTVAPTLGSRPAGAGATGRPLWPWLGGAVLLLLIGVGAGVLVSRGGGSEAALSPGSPGSPAAGECVELASYEPALAQLPAPEIERRLRSSGLVMPSSLDETFRGMRASLATLREERRDCAYRAMLLGQLSGQAQIAATIPGGWAAGRPSADLAQAFRTVPLRRGWSATEREQVLAWVERHLIANLRAEDDADREYWRHMYYGLLIQCEATDDALRALGARSSHDDCLGVQPGMP